MKGCPYDNAVAEVTFKFIKTEFVKGQHFDSLEELTRELHDYVHWFNHIRIHGTLGYVSPIDYKLEHLKHTNISSTNQGHGLCYYFFIVEVKEGRTTFGTVIESVL
jgi:hypothetical protein